MNLRPVEFQIEGTFDLHDLGREVRIVQRMGFNGERWAVLCRRWVLNQDGDWEFEPQPSSRDDAFMVRCRFMSPEDALAAYERRKSDP